MELKGVKITWLGHATFAIDTPEGKKLLVDPWLAGNPKCPESFHQIASDGILVTHGHSDHIGDLVSAQQRCDGPIVSIFEIASWLQTKGAPGERMQPMNRGGSISLDALNLKVTMTDARHSSAMIEEDGSIVYLGEASGFVVHFSNDIRLYIAGDTSVFGDMSLIAELYAPQIAILPIGDRFTMGPREAAKAAELLRVKAVIPCHFGTFPLLTGTPEALREELATDVELIALEPGQTAS